MLLLLNPITLEEFSWLKAKMRDSADGYGSYLSSWPKGRHVTAAKPRYDARCWAEAKQLNTASGYEHYSSSNPDGEHIADAEKMAKKLRMMTGNIVLRVKEKHWDRENYVPPRCFYTLEFRETNGVAVTLERKKTQLIYQYGPRNFENWQPAGQPFEGERWRCEIPANDCSISSDWISEGDDHSGGRLHLDFSGTDANGHPVVSSVDIEL